MYCNELTLLVAQLLQREILLNTSAQNIVALFRGTCALHAVNCNKLTIQEQN